jgi:hypothetical protein
MPKRDRYPQCFGPYLRYAISTNFKNIEYFDGKSLLFFLVALKKAGQANEFVRNMRKAGSRVELGPTEKNASYVTMRSLAHAVRDSGARRVWDHYVSRVELSLPLKATIKRNLVVQRTVNQRWADGKYPPGALLIGVLDDGCPFAAAQFLGSQAGTASTRVRAIWDQDTGKQPVPVIGSGNPPRLFGEVPSDFNYGLEFRRDFAVPSQQMGLDEWIGRHLTPTGSIDEDGCYADAGFTNLALRKLHGAHVMDVFAGRVPTSSRIGPMHPGQDRRDPPSWLPGTDPACKVDLVFVQFSQSCIRDATGVWLKAYVHDAVQYILSHADPIKTKNVVINLSYGPTTGPHDGLADLETDLTAFVEEFNGTPGKPKLEIVLAAGNSYLTDGHIQFPQGKSPPDHVEWTWRLPPDNTVLCFAEIWMKSSDAGGVDVTLTSPSGVTFTPATATTPSSPAGVDGPLVQGSDAMWRLQVEPTVAASGVVAEHGDYTIKVTGIPKNAELHAYVARTDPNLGVYTGAQRSHFVDPNWERTRSASAGCTYVDGEFDNTGSLIQRGGTLNGIATAEDPSVHVAGGYFVINGRKSPYSSAGPARSGPLTLRRGPDFVLPGDETFALQGIRAGGTRSGSVFRLVGTSTAAPQLAREVARGPLPAATRVPTTPAGIAERGGGDLEPP